jgi:glycosyltransferase involved in cell wall biosynthesis
MPKIIINGDFFCNKLTGIERFAFEITKKLDLISQKNEIGIIIPKNAQHVPQFDNLLVILYNNDIISFPKWQQFILPRILKKYNAIPLDYGNSCSLFHPGITFLHDIYCEVYPNDFKTLREKFECLYFRIMYRIIIWRAKRVITVSNYSKKQILEKFKVRKNKVEVIYSSWNHFETITPDYSVFNDFPILSKPYFFSLGSLSKRKNIKWIIEYAIRSPNSIFAISGTSLPTVQISELNDVSSLKNIILLGYLDDSKVKALMEKCKAFILPSYYEGFGLTPLEALSCKTPIVVSNAASLPEIYGNTAHYINPLDTDVDLDLLLKEPVDPPDDLLAKYSYEKSALSLYNILKEFL